MLTGLGLGGLGLGVLRHAVAGGALGAIGALSGCGSSGFRLGRAEGDSSESARLRGFLEEVFLTDLDRSPTLADRVGTRPATARWDDRSEAFLRETASILARDLSRATRDFEPARLDPQEELDRKAFALDRRVRLEAIDLRAGTPPLGATHGPQVEAPLHLLHLHPLRTQEEAELYVERTAALADELERLTRRLWGERAPRGLDPAAALEAAASCLPLQREPGDSPLAERLRRALDVLPGGDARTRERLLARMAEELGSHLRPAALGLSQVLQELATGRSPGERVAGPGGSPGETRTELPAPPEGDPVGDLPGDAAGDPRVRPAPAVGPAERARAYRAALVRHTTSDLGPQQLHALGVSEVLRVQRELVELMRQVDFRGNLGAFLRFAREELPARLGEADLEPAARLGRAQSALTRLRNQAGLAVALAADEPLELVLHDPRLAPLPGGVLLIPGAEDGSRPARLVIEPDVWPAHQLVAMLARFAVPGQHLAFATALARTERPRTRRHARWTARDEGWGLYAARLVREQRGLVDPWDELGMLGQELLAAALTVVDTAVHDRGWGRERALDHLLAETPASVEVCRRELDRVLAEPGRAPAATVGLTRLMELRQRVRGRMGDAYQAPEYHAELLRQGSLPLDELDEVMLAWAADAS